MARPPSAREGNEEASAGRPIKAGVAPFHRPLSPRASLQDLWSAARSVAHQTRPNRRTVNRRHLAESARFRYRAFIEQAAQYYSTLPGLDAVAKPLTAYYFALNLTKAFLTLVDPQTTEPTKAFHGLTDAFERKARYFLSQERFTIKQKGVFQSLALHTGMKFCYPNGTQLRLDELMPYLIDGYDLYSDATGEAPRLLEVADVLVLFKHREAWLRVEIDRNVLRQRNISPANIGGRAAIFGEKFRLVEDRAVPTASYESRETVKYGHRRSEALRALCSMFDESLLSVQRTHTGGRYYIFLSKRPQLLSAEALTFAVLHHMSNMVRYRPQEVEKLKGTPHFWLFSSWVDRACENFLLSLSTRITGEEHIVA